MSARARSVAMALILPLFAACDRAETTGVDPSADGLEAVLPGDVLSSEDPRTRDGGIPLFDYLAAQIESFGGLYRTDQCSITLVLTDLTHAERAAQIVRDALRRQVGPRWCADGFRVIPQKGDFTYVQLSRWLVASKALIGGRDGAGIRGVLGTALNIPTNRLVVTIAAREVAAAVLEALPRVGIPAAAVTFQVGRSTSSR